MEKKKQAAAAAVLAYISSEEAAAAAAAAQISAAGQYCPSQMIAPPVHLPSPWAAGGRSDMMNMRQMMTFKAFSGSLRR